MTQLVPVPDSWGKSTHYCDRFHYFYVTIPRCYKGVYVKSFFPCIARLWNSLPIECFPLSYDPNGLKFGINRQLLNRFPVWFNIFVLLFCVTSCLVVVIQPYTKWILLKKMIKWFWLYAMVKATVSGVLASIITFLQRIWILKLLLQGRL